MRIKIGLDAAKPILLQPRYPLLIRGLIYSLLPENFANFLHNIGYVYEKRRFKLYTFSRLFGKKIKNPENSRFPLVFAPPVHFYLSSPISDIMQYVATALIRREEVSLGENTLLLKAIEVEKEPIFSDRVVIKMISPMAIRSTLTTGDGKKKSYYYNPFEAEFSDLMHQNLLKKYKLVYHTEPGGEFTIKPVRPGRERILKGDDNFVIKAWDGVYELQGTPELIQLSYSTGLGEKNSLGLGMWVENDNHK